MSQEWLSTLDDLVQTLRGLLPNVLAVYLWSGSSGLAPVIGLAMVISM